MSDIARGLLTAALCSLTIFSLFFALLSRAIGGDGAGGEIMLGLIFAAAFGFGAYKSVRSWCAPDETGESEAPAALAEPAIPAPAEGAPQEEAAQADPYQRGGRIFLTAIAFMISQRAVFWIFDPNGNSFGSGLSQLVLAGGIVMAIILLVSWGRMELDEQRRV